MLSFVALLAVSALDTQEAFLRDPDIHGNDVVFACEGDLWLGDIATRKATRLTSSPGVEANPRFSPDGTQIGFTASYEGLREVYVMPTTGGAPRRVTFTNSFARMLDWMPDGKSVVVQTDHRPAYYGLQIVPASGGVATRIPLEFASHASMAPDGSRFAFTRFARSNSAWFRYEGGQKNDIWIGDLKGKTFRKIHSSRFTNEFPSWAGDRIGFVKDEGNGTFSVASVGPDGQDLKRHAGPYPLEVRGLRSDGKKFIYQKGIGLETVDLSTGKIEEVSFSLLSDKPHTTPYWVPAEQGFEMATVGPTGKRVLVETRGQIVSLPVKEGEARIVVARDGVRFRHPALSPDGKKLAYLSDETGEQQLYVADADGSNPKRLTNDTGRQLVRLGWSPNGKTLALTDSNTQLRLVNADGSGEKVVSKFHNRDGSTWSFSPDSKWLAYMEVDRITFYWAIALYEVATGKSTVVSDWTADEGYPAFSSDGKWLAFLSKRNIAPKWDPVLNQLGTENPMRVYLLALADDAKSPLLPRDDEEGVAEPEQDEKKAETTVRIDLDGLYRRMVELPIEPGNYNHVEVAGDRVLLGGEEGVTYFDLKAKKGGSVLEGADSFQVSADHKSLLLQTGKAIQVVSVEAEDVKPNDGRVGYGRLRLRIDPPQEWTQMYWDAWRLLRDYFYVENMHGAPWSAIGAKYAKYLPMVRSRDELGMLLRWLQSELSTGHMYVESGDVRALDRPSSPAFLGIDVEPDPSGFYKIARILRGDPYRPMERSPLAEPGMGVKEGDYLIEVAGVPARVGSNYGQNLVDRAGQVVSIKVNSKPSTDGARTVHVKPIPSESGLRYREWVRANREYVAKASGGKVGYLHLDAMGEDDMGDFIRQYFAQRNRDALIVDLRFNGGGNISNSVATILKQKVTEFFNLRADSTPWSSQGDYFAGPMVCMVNEFSASNGESFPHQFRALGLGPIIGRRTWGGLVGSDPGWPLADGGRIYVPNYGAWTPKDGWIVESTGVTPDIDVESDPNLFARGIDPQLDKAVSVLLEKLKANPVVRPKQPADPVRAGF